MRFSLKLLMVLWIVLIVGAGALQAKTLIVGCDTGFKPFVFIGPDGSYTGFDIELWESIAKRLKLDYKLERMAFKDLIPALVNKKIDVALAGITIISQREKQIDFSFPYYESGLRILVRAGDNQISDIGDLDQKVVATKQGTTSAKFVNNIQTGQVRLFRTIDEAYRALQKGRVDAVIFDSPSILNYIHADGKDIAKIVGRSHQRQYYGIAFQQGSDLREKVSIEILKYIEEGYYDIVFRKWFGYVPQ
jgi:glutamine transport system substrate-binding protein